ncbi:hypothetical protein [Hymenobacter guriensis]|jgi:hypothetical protein|uniref:Uncharacterized protein n=1 Tax=Hymenobacter guriensis TaxID=2793065 RepID=A0ABS0L6M7_9BACT|nr:hypothetical protein [Hymenobacter guriensis]MBG8555754.1 hypothetical protein [Hymenobacter guriensis]
MHSHDIDRLLQQLAEKYAKSPELEIEAGWQKLAARLDQTTEQSDTAIAKRHCVDRPGPHGGLAAVRSTLSLSGSPTEAAV